MAVVGEGLALPESLFLPLPPLPKGYVTQHQINTAEHPCSRP